MPFLGESCRSFRHCILGSDCQQHQPSYRATPTRRPSMYRMLRKANRRNGWWDSMPHYGRVVRHQRACAATAASRRYVYKMPAGPARVRNLSHDPHDFSAGTHAADHRRPTVPGVEWFGRTDITGDGGALHLAPDLAGQPTHHTQVSGIRYPVSLATSSCGIALHRHATPGRSLDQGTPESRLIG